MSDESLTEDPGHDGPDEEEGLTEAEHERILGGVSSRQEQALIALRYRTGLGMIGALATEPKDMDLDGGATRMLRDTGAGAHCMRASLMTLGASTPTAKRF